MGRGHGRSRRTVTRRVLSVAAALWLALCCLGGGPAAAHVDGTMGYATVSLHDGTVRYRLTLGIDALEALGGAIGLPPRQDCAALRDIVTRKVSIAADGIACAAVPGTVTPPSADRANVVITIDFACHAGPHELTLRDTLSEAFGPGHHSLTSIEAPGGTQRFTLEAGQPEARVALGPATAGEAPAIAPGSGLLAFFRLGAEHILGGFDHLLFLLALLLRGGRLGSLLAIVTAFTLAHSITLALAVLDLLVAAGRAGRAADRAVHRLCRGGEPAGRAPGDAALGGELRLRSGARLRLRRRAAGAGAAAGGTGRRAAVLQPRGRGRAGRGDPAAAALVLWLRRRGWGGRALAGTSVLLLVAGLGLLVERVLVAAG